MKVFSQHTSNDGTNFLFNLLPSWFRENDSYKTISEPRGLLERYYEVLCGDIDDNVVNKVEGLYDLTYIPSLYQDDELIPLISHIEDLFGIPKNTEETSQVYYNLLTYFIHILRTRGSIKSLKLYLNIHGYQLVSLIPTPELPITYDMEPTPVKYDDGEIYDKLDAYFHSIYSLNITDYPGTGPHNPSVDYLDKMKEIINGYINPFYSKLEVLNYG